jgi:hemoglobin-like flavoprotein
MLGVAVRGLDRPEQLVAALEALGRRHVGYHVRDAHYATVGEALLWTLEQGLGAAFTAEAREAWTLTYGLVSSVMRSAAHGLAAPAAPPSLAPA